MNIIELRNVSFSYNNRPILSKINLKIKKGDFVAIVGPNGAGKSTLVRVMLGILKPSSGEIFLFGKPLAKADRTKVSYISQRAVNFDQQFPATVYEIVSSGLEIKNNFKPLTIKQKKRIDQTLKSLSIYSLKDKLIGDLSGGQQQKVFIARAIVSDAELLVLDEPTNNIDFESQDRLYSILHELNNKGKTIVLISHDIGTVTRYAKSILCIGNRIFKHTETSRFDIDNFKKLFYNRDIILHNHR